MGLKEIEVTEPQGDIINSHQQFNLFLAGVGSGKSHTMGLVSGTMVCNFPEARGLISANTYSQLTRSTLARVYKVWHEYFGLKEDVHFVVDKKPPEHFKIIGEKLKDYKNTISFVNGAVIWLASLDNYKVIDGMEVSWALLDETKDTKEEAVKEVIMARLRQNVIFIDKDHNLYDHKPSNKKVSGFNPLYIFTSPAKVQWLNEMFEINQNIEDINKVIFSDTTYYCEDHGDKRVVISSTYHNAHNLPDNYIESRRKIWDETPGLTDMLIYGSPIAKSGGEWYSRFDREIHILQSIEFDKKYPLHVTFDFNVVPYMSALALQIIPVKVPQGKDYMKIRVIKEYALAHPNNTTGDVCDEIVLDYAGITNSIYYYGDASGRARSTAITDKSQRHNYDVIRTRLAGFLFEGSDRVPKSNPPISGRRILMNRIFSGNAGVVVEIDASCVNLINDLDYLKEDGNGGYLKPKVKDKNNGTTYEKLGHHSDCFIYFCWDNFAYLINFE